MANIPFLNNAYFTGNVGIGEDTPDTSLHISNVDDVYLTLDSTHATIQKEVAIKYSNFGTTDKFWWAGLNQSDQYSLAYGTAFTGALTKFVVTAGGAVGIGTIAPQAPLHVTSTTDLGDALVLEFKGISHGGPYQTFQYNEGLSSPSETGASKD
jgi:hypothetical protein